MKIKITVIYKLDSKEFDRKEYDVSEEKIDITLNEVVEIAKKKFESGHRWDDVLINIKRIKD